MKRLLALPAFLLLCAAPAFAQPAAVPPAQADYEDFFPQSLSPADAGMTAQEGDARLLKAVVLSRHGVRSPTQPSSVLTEWSLRPWPQWGIEPGWLTERGAALIRAEWTVLRQSFARDGLLPSTGCPDSASVFVYADGSQRSRATAEALLQGLAPGCGISVTAAREKADPILHPVENGAVPPPDVPEDERRALAGKLASLHHDLADELAGLEGVLGPSPSPLCPSSMPCALSDIPTSLIFPHADSREGIRLRGGMAIASSSAETLLLQCLQWPARTQRIPVMKHRRPDESHTPVEETVRAIMDAPASDVPGGLLPPPTPSLEPSPLSARGEVMTAPQTALRLLPAHSNVLDAVQRFPAMARAGGLPLLRLMAGILEGDSALATADDAALAIFSGHDTNIAHIAALLDLHWNGGAFPADSIPPGSMLVFRLWQTPQGRVVQASFLSQTLAALLSTDEAVMRSAALHEEALRLPGATLETPAGPGMELEAFSRLVRSIADGTTPRQTVSP